MPKVVENCFFWVFWEACLGHGCSLPNHESLHFCLPVEPSLGDSARGSFLHLKGDNLLVLMLQRSLQTKTTVTPPYTLKLQSVRVANERFCTLFKLHIYFSLQILAKLIFSTVWVDYGMSWVPLPESIYGYGVCQKIKDTKHISSLWCT
jgi:hypothetical protein